MGVSLPINSLGPTTITAPELQLQQSCNFAIFCVFPLIPLPAMDPYFATIHYIHDYTHYVSFVSLLAELISKPRKRGSDAERPQRTPPRLQSHTYWQLQKCYHDLIMTQTIERTPSAIFPVW